MTKKELKNAIKELHRINIMISKDVDFYNKEIDNHFSILHQREVLSVSTHKVQEKKCKCELKEITYMPDGLRCIDCNRFYPER